MVASRPNVEVSLLACLACPTETELLDFVEGRLDGAPATTIEDHLDGCADCRTLVAHLVADPAGGRALRDDVSGSARLGRFVILGAVGAGGMGVVYAAYDPRLDRKVALKVLRPVIAEDEISGRVLREAQAMARLSHPNAVQVYEVGELGDRVFVAMELVEGGTLAEWLRKSPRSTAEIVAMFVQAGRGLEAAHAAGLVHRDFKPANVLVGTDGRARVTDFGLAHGAGGELGGAVGTPGYVAPEQQAGGVVDARADQYAFSAGALSRAGRGARVAEAGARTGRGRAPRRPIRDDGRSPRRSRREIPGSFGGGLPWRGRSPRSSSSQPWGYTARASVRRACARRRPAPSPASGTLP